ncbi:hypothetical protein [Micromonospora sp. SL4-19]|uniref:hypothetical protein n=1 Tax=Micromonospora sp. SL4-19 TaxID=3399129 RepID=UPI003A4E2FA0
MGEAQVDLAAPVSRLYRPLVPVPEEQKSPAKTGVLRELFKNVVMTGVGVEFVTRADDWKRWLGPPMIFLGLMLIAWDVKRWRARR